MGTLFASLIAHTLFAVDLMKLHSWIGLLGNHSCQGIEGSFQKTMNGQFMQFVQRQVHEFCKIAFNHQIFTNEATHHIAHGAELA
jgi:hypothetical protein